MLRWRRSAAAVDDDFLLPIVARCWLFSGALHLCRVVSILVLFSAAAVSAFATPTPLPRTISSSRQFIVYGPDARLRGGICSLAERTKSSALSILQQRDGWRTPILVQARFRRADEPEIAAARLNVSQTGFGLKLQLDLTIANELNSSAIQRELLSATLLEFMYRDAPDTPAGTEYVRAPEWLVDGLLALQSDDNGAVAAETLAQRQMTPLPEFLQQQPQLLEPLSRAVYRAYAGALITMLINSRDGRTRLAAVTKDLLQTGGDFMADLRAHFPELNVAPEALQQRWTSAVTQFAAKDRFRMLTCADSERQLASSLSIRVAGPKGEPHTYALEQFAEFVRLTGTRPALAHVNETLLILSGRANPLYAPIIAEYRIIIDRLSRRKTGKIAERLAVMREAREEISRRMTAIEDYLNWFEATQSGAPSGAFADYLQAAESAGEKQSRRHDAISVYLDAVETQLAPAM